MTNTKDRESRDRVSRDGRLPKSDGDVALDDLFARTFEREGRASHSSTGAHGSEHFRPPFSPEGRRAASRGALPKHNSASRSSQRGAPDALSMVPGQIAGLPSGKKAKNRHEPKRMRGVLLSAFLIGLAIVGSAGVYMLQSRSSGQDGTITAPTIMANTTPYKVRPANPGGLHIANKDKLVYNRLAPASEKPRKRVETLLAAPVVPSVPERRDARIPSILDPVDASTAPGTDRTNKAPRVSSPAAIQPVQKPTVPKQAKRDESVRAGSSERKAQPDSGVSISSTPVVTAKLPLKATQKSAEDDKRGGGTPVAQVAPPSKAVAMSGPYTIQLAALRDEASVRTLWSDLQKRYPKQLGPLSIRVERADLGQKGVYYRLRATGLPTDKAARTVCRELSKDKVACLFVGK